MKIGNNEFTHGLFLAPMAGITDHAFRAACVKYGAEGVCTELISAKAVTYGDKKTDALACLYPDERPAAIQIFGSEPEVMAEGAKRLLKFDPIYIDINMGCPVTKLVRNGEGSALMRSPDKCKRIVAAVCEAVNVPVTVKIRKYCDEGTPDAVEIARACANEGASAVFVHGRTRAQLYSGSADYGIIARVKDAVDVPVIGNGDVASYADYVRIKAETGCDGVMIGRGSYGAPWVFAEIISGIMGREHIPPSNTEKRETLITQLDTVISEKGERAVRELRHHLLKYCRGFRGSAVLRNQISSVSSRESVLEVINTVFPE